MCGRASAAQYGGIDEQELAPFVEARRLHGLVWHLLVAERFPDQAPLAQRRLAAWRVRSA